MKSQDGFTLIEMLVVIVIIAILAAMVAPNVFSHVGTAKVSATRSQIEMLGAALDSYRLDNDNYPSTAQGLEALRREPLSEPRPRNWRGPYLRRDVPIDPWGREYQYREPGTMSTVGYDLFSLGADGQDGGDGDDADIVSW
jgi:general secretion pathway protein G